MQGWMQYPPNGWEIWPPAGTFAAFPGLWPRALWLEIRNQFRITQYASHLQTVIPVNPAKHPKIPSILLYF
jgi:hypothetical protein